jgi:5-methylcytosine-specific restriction endonuclease McrA
VSTKCTLCGKHIYLRPTARERAAKSGGTEAEYKALFTAHSECLLEKRKAETKALMKRLRDEADANRVAYPLPMGN